MKIKSFMLMALVTVGSPQSLFAAQAASDTQLKAIVEMGRLNGIALQCRYLPQVQQIKRELVKNLPRQRALGDWFEQQTNESFMAFMQKNEACPAPFDFDGKLQQATKQLAQAFKK